MIRVLHVVENFNGQAVESWLTQVVNHELFDSNQYAFDFILLGVGRGTGAAILLAKGCKFFETNPHGNASLPQMAIALRRVVKSGGYDAVHIHGDVLAGVFAVALLGIDVEIIAQAHNCHQRLPVGGTIKERLLTLLASRAARQLSDVMIGVSTVALRQFTGGKTQAGRRDRVIYCGVDPTKFLGLRNTREEFRRQVKLPAEALVLLFVGRLVPEKNPGWVLEVLMELRKLEPNTVAVLVGRGALEDDLRARASELGLDKAMRLLGWRSDIPEVMAACDCLIHTGPESPMEGFGLVALEAQLAGLRVALSAGIPDEAILPGSSFRRLTLKDPAAKWAAAVKELLLEEPPAPDAAAAELAKTKMEQTLAFRELLELYRSKSPVC